MEGQSVETVRKTLKKWESLIYAAIAVLQLFRNKIGFSKSS